MRRKPIYRCPTRTLEHQCRSGRILEVQIPLKNALCWRCRGEGKHTNPAIDGHGISPEEFAEDPDFEEGYFSGRYDIRCEECHGEKIIKVPDWDRIPKRHQFLLEHDAQEEADYRALCEAERRMGC